jgi:hypothetical protein
MRNNRFVPLLWGMAALLATAFSIPAPQPPTANMPVPVANCQNTLIVNLEVNGTRTLSASSFDGGSFDLNGGPLWFKVRRVNPNSPCSTDTLFRSQITFCCAEAGDTLLVNLRVYNVPLDTSAVTAALGLNNAADCTVKVVIRENIPPVIDALPPLQISCDNYLNGSVTFPVITENCCMDTVFYQDNFFNYDTLCRTGIIFRRFTARDCSGNTATSVQSILVSNEQFYGVRFPNDTLVNTCAAVPQLRGPVILDGTCERMVISYTDSFFYQNLAVDACYLIRRRWRLYNQCDYNPNLGLVSIPNPQPDPDLLSQASQQGPVVAPMMNSSVVSLSPGSPPTDFNQFWSFEVNGYQYTQLIWVRDTVSPIALNRTNAAHCDVSGNNPQLWSGGNWFDPVTGNGDLREMSVNMRMLAFDACDQDEVNVQYQLFLDLDASGSPETVVTSGTNLTPGFILYNNLTPGMAEQRQFDRRILGIDEKYRFSLSKTIVNDSVICAVQWNTTAAPNTFTPAQLPYGFHRIEWLVTDKCGNPTTLSHAFTVSNDCVPPTISCQSNITLELPAQPDTTVEVRIEDVLLEAIDNITLQENLVYSIQKAPFSSALPLGATLLDSVVLTCDDLGFPPLRVWVRDQAGNSAFCQSYITLSDPLGLCQSDATAIRGRSRTVNGLVLPQVQYTLTNIGDSIPIGQHLSGSDGWYYFNQLPPFGNYRVTPTRTFGSWLNGVNTFDLVLISRHLLALELFDSPYEIIAADINNSGTLSTFDVVVARQTLLGVRDTFINNRSWRFVAANYVFPQPDNPAAFTVPGWRFLTNHIGVADSVDFVAIKIGDLNLDFNPNELNTPDERELPTDLSWILGSPEPTDDGQWRTPVWAQAHRELSAFQGTFGLQHGRLLHWESPWLTNDYVHLTDSTWHISFDKNTMATDAPIWAGWLYADTPVSAAALSPSPFGLPCETYTPRGTKGAIALSDSPAAASNNALDRLTVWPNPFDATLTLHHDGQQAHWQVFDAWGRSLLRLHSTSEPVQVSTAHWPAGVYWLRCDTELGTRQLQLIHR